MEISNAGRGQDRCAGGRKSYLPIVVCVPTNIVLPARWEGVIAGIRSAGCRSCRTVTFRISPLDHPRDYAAASADWWPRGHIRGSAELATPDNGRIGDR